MIVALAPLTRIVIGTKIGVAAAVFAITIGCTPFATRMTENSLQTVDPQLVRAAKAFGASKAQIICKVMLVEALPTLVSNFTIMLINMLNMTAMAGAVGLVYRRPQQANFKPVFLGVSGGDTDSRIYLGDGSVSTAETGLSTVFGIYTPDDRTWARHDLWFTDKFGDAQGTRSWWGLVQDGDELRIVKDKGTPTAYATKAYVDGLVGDIQAALAAI